MRTIGRVLVGLWIVMLLGPTLPGTGQAQRKKAFVPAVPKTWDDAAIATLEVPLANPICSPKHVPASYYYKIPVRPIYKQYPLYAPKDEPPGYMDWLKKQEPQIVWDDAGRRPPLRTEADWIKAGETVFESPTNFGPVVPLAQLASEIYPATQRPRSAGGVNPFAAYVIRQKGKVEVGFASCADCHTRVMPDGSVIRGAQGNDRLEYAIAVLLRAQLAAAEDKQSVLKLVRLGEQSQFEVPWLPLSKQIDYSQISVDQIAASHAAIPAGIFARGRTSVLSPPHIPDLIGVKDLKYLDATGLQRHRGIADLMRYSAMNQGADDLASYGGFVPADLPNFKTLPDADKLASANTVPNRYSDEQLYALALYIYSLKPPSNSNPFNALAAKGKRVFAREGCAMCHTPPLYSNNKLTLAEGFTSPPDAEEQYDILPVSVGTDPVLATKTRRGTGYYKVPSLRGVWYRSMFGHSGWCATLEDWFDPRRTRDDYIPTGFKPYNVKTYSVKGHPFGLELSAEDKKALIAFLKTL